MSALPIEAAPAVDLADSLAVLALARSYGRLRAVTPDQAPVIRAATELDRSLRPRWQRRGDGVHEAAAPGDYAGGVTWQRRPEAACVAAWQVDPDGVDLAAGRVRVRTGSPHVGWRNRRHWLDVVVPAAIAQHPEALETARGRVSAARLLAWATEVSKYAHPGTGRRCIVRVDRLAELLGVTKSTAQRCQAAAEALGLYVVIRPGRMLDQDESYAARRSGSAQRGLANDASLVIPAWLPREAVQGPLERPTRRPVENPRRRRHLAAVPTGPDRENDTPTSGSYGTPEISRNAVPSRGEKRFAGDQEPTSSARSRRRSGEFLDRDGVCHPATGPEAVEVAPRRPRRRPYDPEALRVARGLVAALPWLRGVEPGRLEPTLRRFVRCALPWTAADFVTYFDAENKRLGRASMTRDLVRSPLALFAGYTRTLDYLTDHPRAGRSTTSVAPIARESAQQLENRLLLEAHRAGGAGQRHEVIAGTVAGIRDDLAARRALRDTPADN